MWKTTCGKLTASAGATRIPLAKRNEDGWEEEFWNLIRTANVDDRQLVSEQDIEFRGCMGKAFVFDMSIRGTPAKIHTRFLIGGGFLYELNWIVPADNPRQDEMAKFFDSFAIKGVNDRPSGSEGVLSAESPSGPPLSRADSAAQTASSEPATSRLPSRETLPSSQRPKPTTGYRGTLTFPIVSYRGTESQQSAASRALSSIPWVDANRITIDEQKNRIVVGVRGVMFFTGEAKSALESAGFQIGNVGIAVEKAQPPR